MTQSKNGETNWRDVSLKKYIWPIYKLSASSAIREIKIKITLTFLLKSEWLSSRTHTHTNTQCWQGCGVEKKPLYTVVGKVNLYKHEGDQYEYSPKLNTILNLTQLYLYWGYSPNSSRHDVIVTHIYPCS